MELRQFIDVLRRRWWVVLTATIIGLLGGAAVTYTTTPQYETSARVFVALTGSTGVNSSLLSGSTYVQQQVASFAELATTPLVLSPVIARLGLDESATRLAARVTATAPADRVLIDITVRDPDPASAAAIANAVATQLNVAVTDLSTDATTGLSPVTIETVQPATVPTAAVAPNARVNLAVGGILGLLLSIAVLVAIALLDTRLRDRRAVEAATTVPILAAVPFTRALRSAPLIAATQPHSPTAEAMRTLRANLQFATVDDPARRITVTSAAPSDGKSTVASNLAISLAESGSSVVLVDADLRKPMIAEYFGIERAVGVSDVLVGQVPLDRALKPWGSRSLSVLTAGTAVPNPAELLSSRAMSELITALEARFDMIVVDSPPLGVVADGAVLARQVGGILMVVSLGRTRRPQLEGALAALEKVAVTPRGVVLNGVKTEKITTYGYVAPAKPVKRRQLFSRR